MKNRFTFNKHFIFVLYVIVIIFLKTKIKSVIFRKLLTTFMLNIMKDCIMKLLIVNLKIFFRHSL